MICPQNPKSPVFGGGVPLLRVGTCGLPVVNG